ncbi:MAG: hypothetical protein JNM53_15465 [Gemmatimonadetes bacterium]|nr:hypothetical protein [Gemmatimonadota bacterium]
MSPQRMARLALALLVALGVWFYNHGRRGSPAPAEPAAPPVVVEAPPAPGHPEIGFRSRTALTEHFAKHGAEFGQITEGEYLRRAQALRDRPAGGEILEARRSDRVVTRFDRGTGDFLAFDPDYTIRTYFRPNDGEAYFRRQARRLPDTP